MPGVEARFWNGAFPHTASFMNVMPHRIHGLPLQAELVRSTLSENLHPKIVRNFSGNVVWLQGINLHINHLFVAFRRCR